MVEKFPVLLTLDVDSNLAPKFRFYEKVAGPEEALRSLVSSPSILGFSLDKRIKPRYWCDSVRLACRGSRTYPDEYTHMRD